MWGFVTDTGSCPTSSVDWQPGPTLQPTDGSLTVNLRNCLEEPVSIVIPGQAATGTPVWVSSRVRSFTDEASVGGTVTASYTWTGLKAGTYLYQSGTHPAKQVQMGLYGALIVLPATVGVAYTPTATNPDTGYTTELVLLYSEIDPSLHNPPGVAQPLNYIPEYYLINGKPFQDGDPPLSAGNVNEDILIRFLNAGLKTHVPTLLNAPYMSVIAEDGNLYPYAKEQYSVLLAAGKTMDAIWSPTAQGTYPLVDRANYLTTAGVTDGGMLAYLQVGVTAGAPTAVGDTYTVAEDTPGGLVVAAAGVLTNDLASDGIDAIPTSYTASLVTGPSAGSLLLNDDGSFTYTPNNYFNGTDFFVYRAVDTVTPGPGSNVATVRITVTPVNNAPVAIDDTAATTQDNAVAIAVLANDTDVDGDPLTVTNVTDPQVTVNLDNTVTFTPEAGFTGNATFTYTANDGTIDSNTATVTITVSPVNTAPVAVDDFATTTRNTTVFINLVANDTDAENNLKDASGNVAASQVSVVTQPTRGGTVSVLTNGVNYRPKNNFRGTDVFTYTVTDTGTPPQTSNTATVRVNVTR
jgi:FtsP/CotA-like multicopper oxidase with cupredoxin domain